MTHPHRFWPFKMSGAPLSRWWVRLLVSVTIPLVLLTFVVPVERVWIAIREVNPWVWLATVGIFAGGHALNAMKLRLLLGPAASAASCLRAHFAGISANLGFPGVAGGDIVRAAYIGTEAGLPRAAFAAVTDRIVDSTVLLLIAGTAAWVAGVPPALARSDRSGRWWIVAAIVGLAMVFGVRRLRRTERWARVRAAWGGVVARPGAVALAAAIGLTVQTVFVLTNVWLASEVGLRTALAPWFLGWTAAKLGALLPISVGGIGVREAALVSVLAAYGAPADAVLATGILWEGALVVGSLGGFFVTQLARR